MKLNAEQLSNTSLWKDADINIPTFDRETAAKETKDNPVWIHFGAGNIFRAFPAAAQQRLLDNKLAKAGIIIADGYDTELITKVLRPHDNLTLLATLKTNGTIDKTIIASITESLVANGSDSADEARLLEVFENPSLQMVSFTITEKGYAFTGDSGVVAKVTDLCIARFNKGAYPLSLVSMDNCSHNGEKLFAGVKAVAERRVSEGKATKEFFDYICDPSKVAFPWTMIDKITPRPDEAVAKLLNESGFEDTAITVTSGNTYAAPFVNAEEIEYLVIEDLFPNGRPPLEKAGILFTDRDTVNKVEKMKVCTCLNPLHTAVSTFGCLLKVPTIHQTMADPQLKAMLERLAYVEGMPVVVNPGIINPEEFVKEVLEIRFPNPFMPDTPERIVTDNSQKIPVRFGETIKAYLARPDLSVDNLEVIPLFFAGWCRYLMAVDDNGEAFTPSNDPMLEKAQAVVKGISLGDKGKSSQLKPLLSDASIFGIDLYTTVLGEKAEAYFEKLVAGKGAVRSTLAEMFN